ncbi:hypothetical protein VOLCADRAFT_107657 [Volvox carteri f. nagariensis]|uniref:Calcium uniporter protein C-terminal domain-containing protein n=1 Tax=Volvox carteri f. nagariensis TaxID=3068 RepID=D8UFF9_VOLCA|nr:uncharacterized protein VOLCADRAFT_107657 [Volvox carteri f. nagariensis]EFJ41605.1 hypothetical protein VOLCADRAFT_107657 [Volvox carteri f. nagariensis]|eukprot:XP_002957396.1 hypothetical protein VOLCADRAFT_107657 [Volvox carteri f. nagariensis]
MAKSARLLSLGLRASSQIAATQLCEIQGTALLVGSGYRVPHLLNAKKPWFKSFVSEPEEGDSIDDTFREKLRKVAHVVTLQQDLKHVSELHDSITSEKLFQLILDRGAARDAKEAEELVMAMQRAGVMLLHNKQAYLRPSELVQHCLPDFLKVEELKARLDDIDAKLQPYDEISRIAEKKAWRLLYVGCFFICLQLAAFLRLTYYELSWDVMEPIGYIISLFYTMLGYFFFIYTKGHPFDLHPVKEWYIQRLKGERLLSSGCAELDDERYHALTKARDRYLKQLQFLQKLESRHASGAT